METNLSTKEFLTRKNELVLAVTGNQLLDEDQIVDEPKVKLSDVPADARTLQWDTCPYCVARSTNGRGIDCSTCPMFLAGNGCNDSEFSTWRTAKQLWDEHVTEEDIAQMQKLVKSYNG